MRIETNEHNPASYHQHRNNVYNDLTLVNFSEWTAAHLLLLLFLGLHLFNLLLSLSRNSLSLYPLLLRHLLPLIDLIEQSGLILILKQRLLLILCHRHLLFVDQLLHLLLHLHLHNLVGVLATHAGLVLHFVEAHKLLLFSDEIVVVGVLGLVGRDWLILILLLLLSHRTVIT